MKTLFEQSCDYFKKFGADLKKEEVKFEQAKWRYALLYDWCFKWADVPGCSAWCPTEEEKLKLAESFCEGYGDID